MNKRKSIIIMLIVFLAIGFATVSTTLVLNGILAIGENKDDFNIIFTSARLDGRKRNDFISEDKKHINFVSNELKTLEDKAILTYEVTNTSRNYDAGISVTCTAGSTELITFEYTPHQMEVLAGETKTGSLTASMFKLVDEPTEVPIECTLTGTAKERVDLGEEYITPFSRSGVMKVATNPPSAPTGMWSYRSNVTKVIFEDKLEPHETTEELTFDVSDKQDKSVMAYLVPNGETLTTNTDSNDIVLENTTAYTLYIQGDTGVIANNNSSYLFYEFNNLLDIDNLQYLDTSNVSNMSAMFCYCQSLTTLDISNFTTLNVTKMTSMFSYCNNLISLDFFSFDTSKVQYMYRMFYSCSSLEKLDLSNFNTSNVTSMSSMFYNCSSLKELNLDNFDTSSVLDMSNMFDSCLTLGNLNVSGFNTSNVTSMHSMFEKCSNLKKLNLDNFNTTKVTDMWSMFNDCNKLVELDVSSFDTSNVTYMNSMFYHCKSLINIDVSNFDTSNVTSMVQMFRECSSVLNLNLSSFNTSKVTNMNGLFDSCNELIELNIGGFDTSSVTDMSFMFNECQKLTDLNLNHFNTLNVTDLECMFRGCKSLKKLSVSSFAVGKVTTFAGMFQECTGLESLDLSNFVVTSNVEISSFFGSIFNWCLSLKYLDISGFSFIDIDDTSKAFQRLPDDATIVVKDIAAQEWILGLTGVDRPSAWTTENVVIKEIA